MIEWEYAYLEANYVPNYGEKEKEFTFYGPTGSTQTGKASGVIPVINKLGKDGWEAFHIEHTQSARIYWFKRPGSR